jgi:hypothetical protein
MTDLLLAFVSGGLSTAWALALATVLRHNREERGER